MKRKNSRRLSLKKLKMNDKADQHGTAEPAAATSVPASVISNSVSKTAEDGGHVKSSTIYDILRNRGKSAERKDSTASAGRELTSKEEIYRKNYKIYDKLLSYGSKAYKKYDKYMTYGTIYEILHRKSDAAEDVFLRKRALSEKFAKRKHSVNSHYSSLKLGTIYDILQGKQFNALESGTSDQSLNSSSSKEAEPNAGSNANTLSTIYDIIHKKADSPKQQTRNRFLVKKITEEEFIKGNENNRNESNTTATTVAEDTTPKHTQPSPDYTTPKPVDASKKTNPGSSLLQHPLVQSPPYPHGPLRIRQAINR
uniref:(northern house mosquito) hypothetical protein n=1 Tax=Culex pipiens TaxID=7175 RepID=A0A8D8HY57_CULPI